MLRAAHSRIPVYKGSRQNVCGILLMKTLIPFDPDDEVPIRQLIEDSEQRVKVFRKAPVVPDDTPLYDMLNEFQKGKSKHTYGGLRGASCIFTFALFGLQRSCKFVISSCSFNISPLVQTVKSTIKHIFEMKTTLESNASFGPPNIPLTSYMYYVVSEL